MNDKIFYLRRRFAVVSGMLLFPVSLAAITMLGFALGITIGKWNVVAALLSSIGVVYLLSPVCRVRNVIWMIVGILGSVILSGLFVMYANADAEAYHRPATILLANGWNPLRVMEPSELVDVVGGGRRAWCVAFIPRMSYIFGAALYQWVGFVESADALNILMFLVAMVFVYDWLKRVVQGNILIWICTLVVCMSPEVISLMWGGSTDAAWYSAFLVAVICASRKMYLQMVLAMLVMCGVKFTGCVVSVLIFGALGLSAVIWERKEFWRLVKVGVITGALIMLVNASPYITSIINHGGPFYPSHSFVKSERFDDDKNPITYDIMLMNDDARQIGWAGRFVWGYISKDLVKRYYAWKLNKHDFSPDFQVSGGFEGFGRLFCVYFVVALLLWPLVKERELNLIAGLILFSVLIQPTIYSGYARYVPQFYLFPILIGLGVVERFSSKWIKSIVVLSLLMLTLTINIKPLSMLPLQWLVSVQNLQVLTAASASDNVIVWSSSNYSRAVLSRDCLSNVSIVNDPDDMRTVGKVAIGSYFRLYKVWLAKRPDDWYDLAHVVSGNDPKIVANRNKNNIKYFGNIFLPSEIKCVHRRISQLVRLRWRQFIKVMGGDTEIGESI